MKKNWLKKKKKRKKCLEDNYKRFACKVKNEKSGNADDKVYVEFLNTYDNVKKEMKQKKGIKEEKTEKKKMNLMMKIKTKKEYQQSRKE